MPRPRVRAFLCLLLLCAGPLAAQGSDRVTVRLDGRAVLRVGPGHGVDARVRAERIERRLGTLLENPGAIVPARVEPSGDTARVVSVAGVPVVTVGQADAEDNVLGRDALAYRMSATFACSTTGWFRTVCRVCSSSGG